MPVLRWALPRPLGLRVCAVVGQAELLVGLRVVYGLHQLAYRQWLFVADYFIPKFIPMTLPTSSPLLAPYRSVRRAALDAFCAAQKLTPCITRDDQRDCVVYSFQHGSGTYTFLLDDFGQCLGRAYFAIISFEIESE